MTLSPEFYESVSRGIRIGSGTMLVVYSLILVFVMRTRRTPAWSRRKAISAVVGVVAAASIFVSSHALAKFVVPYLY